MADSTWSADPRHRHKKRGEPGGGLPPLAVDQAHTCSSRNLGSDSIDGCFRYPAALMQPRHTTRELPPSVVSMPKIPPARSPGWLCSQSMTAMRYSLIDMYWFGSGEPTSQAMSAPMEKSTGQARSRALTNRVPNCVVGVVVVMVVFLSGVGWALTAPATPHQGQGWGTPARQDVLVLASSIEAPASSRRGKTSPPRMFVRR